MTKELSKEQKINVIKKALDYYLFHLNLGSTFTSGMCFTICTFIENEVGGWNSIESNAEYIPEFKRPFLSKIFRPFSEFWYKENDINSRVNYLKRLLKKLEK